MLTTQHGTFFLKKNQTKNSVFQTLKKNFKKKLFKKQKKFLQYQKTLYICHALKKIADVAQLARAADL